MNRWLDLESGGAKYTEYKDWTSVVTPAAVSVGNDLAGVSKPIFQALDPNKEAEFNDKFWKDFVDILPIPLVKPYIKNQLLSE
jgi:DNA phosphorothioation-dependent restriction protein DptG